MHDALRSRTVSEAPKSSVGYTQKLLIPLPSLSQGTHIHTTAIHCTYQTAVALYAKDTLLVHCC
jgi:hypothetical protein